MAESTENLQRRVEAATAPGFRGRLLDRGLARGLIWRDGELPPGAPAFSSGLTEDLLDYAHTVMAMALRLRERDADSRTLERAFLVAGEAVEAAIHRGSGGPDGGFHRVSAAVAFHLARYSARAYSMLPAGADDDNLAPTEAALVRLLRRRLEEMHGAFSTWLLDSEHADEQIANRLRNDEEMDDVDAVHLVLTTAFMRGLALFEHALSTGLDDSAVAAKRQFVATADAARDLRAVSHWWTATLASHLIEELWQLSLHQRIPPLPGDDDEERWRELRMSYIQRLRAGHRSAIELWPSQLTAAQRAVDPDDSLVVALPTSAGKTRIAELCILRALAAGKRVVYVTPLRALSAQVERDLATVFRPLGFTVSSLYGSAGVESGDAETLRDGEIVVSTPEKLDFALRNDASVIDDVALIVLDEGHMLGPNEREVRYEALVQRLLQRKDASDRRIVCLSALFPTPDEMADLVAWIRRDEEGDPIHSTWRPTRQRFGVLQWTSGAARLEVQVEAESPFVPRFVIAAKPPKGSRRRKRFPANKNELTLAAAWRFVEQDKEVLVYCALRKSVETLGKLIHKCIGHGVLAPLRPMNERVENTIATGAEWLGESHPAVQCLRYGVALHHGGLPRPFLNEVERLLRSGDCPLTIASPTLAQGLNLSASVLLVPSIWRNRKIIPTVEFANVAGRAGRAFVDVEGLVLHVVWGKNARDTKRTIDNWNALVAKAKAPRVKSGILLLAVNLFKRIAKMSGVPMTEVVDYVTGHDEAWEFIELGEEDDVSSADWERDVASLDSAILALLDAETDDDEIAPVLDDALEGSLFTRQLEQQNEQVQDLIRAFMAARARRIWSDTGEAQRKGYHAAGIGLSAGQFLDANLAALTSLLRRAEDALAAGDADATAAAVVDFATLVFGTAPFRAPKDLPGNWAAALMAWMKGRPSVEVIAICADKGVDLLQEALTYRLPWAMEAVRVHALAVGHDAADELTGQVALAVEAGTSNRSVIVLARAGLSSRAAAMNAVASTGASFEDRGGMLMWLGSDEVAEMTVQDGWPTRQSRHAWLRFYDGQTKGEHQKWKREKQRLRVTWFDDPPEAGTHVVVEPESSHRPGLVLSPGFEALGELLAPLRRSRRYIVSARVAKRPSSILVEYFGPRALR